MGGMEEGQRLEKAVASQSNELLEKEMVMKQSKTHQT
jgi:hypothetical protein